MLSIEFACKTHTGRVRDHNEDNVWAEKPGEAGVLASKGALFIVADGMGGHQAGEVAAEKAIKMIRQEYYGANGSPDLSRRLSWAVQSANVEVYRLAQANLERAGMGATLVAAAIAGNQAHIAHVGDSRAYLARGGSIAQLTDDHSWVGAQVRAGLLTREQAHAHPQRNVVTRALGAKAMVEVDLYTLPLHAGDVLLLCSDGLTEHVPDGVLWDVVTGCDPAFAVEHLVELANAAGGSDNISVIVAQVGPPTISSVH